MDVADAADLVIEAERAEGLRVATAALAGKGATFCEDCDDVIPLARSRAFPAARRCVDCQAAHEAELAADKERRRV